MVKKIIYTDRNKTMNFRPLKNNFFSWLLNYCIKCTSKIEEIDNINNV